MGIKPAMGWLALLLFTTTAQAGGARDLLRIDPKAPAAAIAPSASKDTAIVARTPIASKSRSPKRERELAPPVTPKTKAPPVVSVTARPSGALAVVESTGKPRADYEAEIYAGIALDAPLAKERGLDRGLVRMVFEQERRPAFRVGRDRIRRVVRLAGPGHAAIAVGRELARRLPELVTVNWWKEERGERVFVDFNQMARDLHDERRLRLRGACDARPAHRRARGGAFSRTRSSARGARPRGVGSGPMNETKRNDA